MRRRLLLLGAIVAVLLVVAAVLTQRQGDNREVRLTSPATWNVGPNTIMIRRVEVGDWLWGGSVEAPPRFLEPVFRRVPALEQWWAATHRQYTLGHPDSEYVSIYMEVSGPNPQNIAGALLMAAVTPDGPIESQNGRWTQPPGRPAELHQTVTVPRGTEIRGLETWLNGQRVSFSLRR